MRKLLIVLTGVALFLAATNPAPCEFRAQVAESIREASDRTSLSGRLKQELQATLLGEAVRLGTRRTDYLLFSVYTLDPTEALQELEQSSASEQDVPPRLAKAQADALRSQQEELREELSVYEALPERSALELGSFRELPLALVLARIAEGLTQKELAERLGLREQQIQRYESTEYRSASWTRIQEVIEALGADVEGEVRLPTGASEKRHRPDE
jgi:DNA-binding XRE family transcriptional regulator